MEYRETEEPRESDASIAIQVFCFLVGMGRSKPRNLKHSELRKKRDALDYLDLCVEPEIRLLASSDSRMRSHSRSACECYCKTRVPIAKQREEIRREKGSRGAKDGGSKSSLGKTETARSARKASLISTNIAHRQQPDSKRSTVTPAASPILSPETSAAIEDVEKLMKDAEIQMREIRMASDYSRLKKRPNLYSNEAPLDDEADQLLYIRERVAHKFEEANGCFVTPNPSFQQRSCNDQTSAAIKSKRIIDFSAPRFRSSDDPYEEFSQQRRRDLEKLGLSSTELKKADEETRKGKAEVAKAAKLETCSVQAGPSVNIKGELRRQRLDNVHISPDSSFAQETQNVATYVVRRDFERKSESPRRRREKIVKISEDNSSNGKSIKRKIAKDRGSGSRSSGEASREDVANLIAESSEEKLVEDLERIGEEEEAKVLEEKAEKSLEENSEGGTKNVDANRVNCNEETKGEEKQVRFESLATQTDATSSKSLSEAAKVQSSPPKESKVKDANGENGRGEAGERCKAETGMEERYEKIGESFANVAAKYRKTGDDCDASLNVANTSGNAKDSRYSRDSKAPEDVKCFKDWQDSEDSQSSTDDLSNLYEPALTELDKVLITYDRMIEDVARSTRIVDEFLSRPELEEYRHTGMSISAKSKRDARKIEAPRMDLPIKPTVKAARDANAFTRKDKIAKGCEFVKTKTSAVKKSNDSKAKRDAATESRRSSKTKEERLKKEESASEWSENRTRDEKLMRITGTEETRSLENANWKHDSSSCIASTKSQISSGKEDWELSEKGEEAENLQAYEETEAKIEKEDPIDRILSEELVEDKMKKLFNADEMVAMVVRSVLENLKSEAPPDNFEFLVRQRGCANFPSIRMIEEEKSQDRETLSATETRKCDEENASRVSRESDRKEESIADSRSGSKGKEGADLRNSPLVENFQARDNGNLQCEENASESLACANTVSKIEAKVEDAEERVGEISRADDENEDDDNETASNAKSENVASATRPDKTPSKVSTEKSSNVESKGKDGEADDHVSSDSLRDCASLRSCSQNVSKEELNKQTLEIVDGESLTSNAAFERERILADVYDEVNKKLFSSASDRVNQDRFSSGVSTVDRNKVEISSESSHSEGELYGASSGSYSLGEIRMLSKSRSDGEATDFDDNIGAFVTKRMLASWNESSKSLVQSMGEI